MDKKLYDIEQLCIYFGVRAETLYRWIDQSDLEGFRAGRGWRFTEQDVKNCEQRLREKSFKHARGKVLAAGAR